MSTAEDSGIYPHNADNAARVYQDKEERLWIAHRELLECGYRGLIDFDIVWINGKFYELQGFNYKAEAWWVEEVPEIEAPETPPEP